MLQFFLLQKKTHSFFREGEKNLEFRAWFWKVTADNIWGYLFSMCGKFVGVILEND